ncbi:MAG: mononuclear molybdenum enzyme YedY [Acidobacteria bacterium RIFCSPLOWO2_12_FULL_65_11]|nr:MAG: mononuclear molybdenum enzyme YedY [Acidobacteria bacterium RIFCSPLOWO2_02_FULL_64_15]OFW28005.1 MAG: mononuclear molybdenum enzyme YedY [Acidobacteria bacterium RIFCSPLOWO2_12_FULL_65_11]
MLIKRPADIPSSEITDRRVYVNRRTFIRAAAAAAAAAGTAGVLGCGGADTGTPQPATKPTTSPASGFADVTESAFSTTEPVNTLEQVSTYNNYYEFGTDKSSPARYAKLLRTAPWSVAVEGECAKPAVWHLEDILRGQTLEERIYRLRCVEAWSMVIPWIGFPLADFIARCEPTSKAKFVQFFTLDDAAQMPGVRVPVLDWPYTEGLRMDEAMHPLTILAVGLYGEVLPNQNGAPIRLVVPWKYGFKGIKSIVRMRFVEQEPRSSWQISAPSEYGFYSNVNPSVDHPRWSQARENRLPGFLRNRPTLMFNGYADQVAQLYSGMDLRRNF